MLGQDARIAPSVAPIGLQNPACYPRPRDRPSDGLAPEDPEVLAVKVSPVNREYLLKAEPEVFFLTEHYRDYPIVLVRLPHRAALEILGGTCG